MAITTIEAAGARSCIALPDCSVIQAAHRSLASMACLFAGLRRVVPFLGMELAAPLSALHIIHGAGASCALLRLEDDRLSLADSLRTPASHPAHRFTPLFRA